MAIAYLALCELRDDGEESPPLRVSRLHLQTRLACPPGDQVLRVHVWAVLISGGAVAGGKRSSLKVHSAFLDAVKLVLTFDLFDALQ